MWMVLLVAGLLIAALGRRPDAPARFVAPAQKPADPEAAVVLRFPDPKPRPKAKTKRGRRRSRARSPA